MRYATKNEHETWDLGPWSTLQETVVVMFQTAASVSHLAASTIMSLRVFHDERDWIYGAIESNDWTRSEIDVMWAGWADWCGSDEDDDECLIDHMYTRCSSCQTSSSSSAQHSTLAYCHIYWFVSHFTMLWCSTLFTVATNRETVRRSGLWCVNVPTPHKKTSNVSQHHASHADILYLWIHIQFSVCVQFTIKFKVTKTFSSYKRL